MRAKSLLYMVLIPVFSCTGFRSPETLQLFEPVAVIELFTSQGCSSCPPADKLLAETIAEAAKQHQKIYALSFHVDYWNRLGWTDPFSDKRYSARQNEYAAYLNPGHVYTPQMIVNGSTEFVGSDKSSLNHALEQALHTNSSVTFNSLEATQQPGNGWHISYELVGDYSGCDVQFAFVSLKETTPVNRGENKGQVLTNEHVVRQFISAQALTKGHIDFNPSPEPKENIAVIAFVQRQTDLKIIGAALATVH